jgi:uncharacterized damage-inducible protein DinB
MPGQQGGTVSELEEILARGREHAAPDRVLGGLGDDLVHRQIAGAPHTIYQELWHIAFWLQRSLDWIAGVEMRPARPEDSFPGPSETQQETWEELCVRFFRGIGEAAAIADDPARLERVVRSSSQPGVPVRTMTVREHLEGLAAHNAYHFGRIVLLRQICGAWPPASDRVTG